MTICGQTPATCSISCGARLFLHREAPSRTSGIGPIAPRKRWVNNGAGIRCAMQLTVVQGVPGSESRHWIACDNDADALSEVWRVLISNPPDLLDICWTRSDGVEFGLEDLRRWARER